MLEFLGIGIGSIEVALERTVFVPGDTVRGTVTLELKEPTPARRMVVSLRAKQKVVSTNLGSRGERSVGYHTDDVFQFEQQLQGEDLYTGGHWSFSIVIPANVLDAGVELPQNTFGDVVRAISFLSPNKRFPIQWQVYAFLDVPLKINVKKAVDVTVTPFVRE